MDMDNGGGLPEGVQVLSGREQRGENWDNCNSIKKKTFFFKKSQEPKWLKVKNLMFCSS